MWNRCIVRPSTAAKVFLDEARLVERVRVHAHLNVRRLGDVEAGVDGVGHRPPVLVELQPAGAGLDLLDERVGFRGVALPVEADVDGPLLGGLEEPLDILRPGRAGGCAAAVPPPSIVVMPDARACSWVCAELKWTWMSSPPGVTIFPSAG